MASEKLFINNAKPKEAATQNSSHSSQFNVNLKPCPPFEKPAADAFDSKNDDK